MARTGLFQWLGKTSRAALAGEKITRREFLKISTKTAAGLTAAAALIPTIHSLAATGKFTSSVSSDSVSPITIAGGGLAGLVTAYRLMQAGVPCELYEASPRLGGRIFTKDGFGPDGLFCELGGELIDTSHTDIMDLCKELEVPLEAFASGDAGLEPAVYFSGGRIRTEAEVVEAFKPLAQALKEDILRIFPDGEAQMPTYRDTFNAEWLDALSISEYLRSKPSIENWLSRLIETAYTGEYGLEASEQSALNLLLLIGTETDEGFLVFGESDEAYRIQGGNSRLIEKLVQNIASKVPIHTRQQLVGIRDNGQKIGLTFRHDFNIRTVPADRVVLAMPFTVLREVNGIDRLNLSPVKKRCIREFGYGTNSKQMMGFNRRFWRNAKSNLPANTGAIFTDWDTQCYWETSRLQPGQSGILTNFLGGRAGQEAQGTQWKKALQDLDQLYSNASEEFNGRTAFFNWSRYKHAKGSYSCPRPGQYTTIFGAAGEPELNERLFFAGEHCSVDWAGFMNGAAQSGNIAANRILAASAVRAQPMAH